jgi:hypothetical protein
MGLKGLVSNDRQNDGNDPLQKDLIPQHSVGQSNAASFCTQQTDREGRDCADRL